MPGINWTEVPGTGFHTADRGGFTIVKTSRSRWRLHRNGVAVSIAFGSKQLAMSVAEDLLPDDGGGEIVLANPPEGEKSPDPTAPPAATAAATSTAPVKLPRFVRYVRPIVTQDGKPLRTWL
jgi:hypothetical protein